MSDSIPARIVSLLKQPAYRPLKARALARELDLHDEATYPLFKQALRDLEDEGVIEDGPGGGLVLAKVGLGKGEVIGKYSGTKRGFGFLDVTEPHGHAQLFIPEEANALRAVNGDIVKAKIFQRNDRQPGDLDGGRITAIIKRAHGRIAGTLRRNNKGTWFVEPEGNVFTDLIYTPDAAGKYLTPGVRVIVELTQYPTEEEHGQGVVAEVLGEKGEKDVDLKMILVQHNLPEDFPDDVKEQAREAVDRFDPNVEKSKRLDFTDQMILTIDPDDAKDYDDAISLERDEDGNWELGVHIADVSFFVIEGTPLDVEAQHRGNSVYFPGHVVPMLPEVLSNGVCSLQEKVDRLTKSAFITIDGRTGKPLRTSFSNTIIRSSQRLRYREAQALIDNAEVIPHPNGTRKPEDYAPEIRKLLADMNHVARLIQKRRLAAGQLVLDLPKVDLVLDQNGKVVDAVPEDESFTHTLIEMFMVEANEAVGRLFNRLDWPAIRRIHPDPDPDASARLGRFVAVAGHRIPEDPSRFDLQNVLASVKGKPEGFAVNLAVLKSLARAEYAPDLTGHFALASDHYVHFTSPIRRYADLTIHRLLDLAFDIINPKSWPISINIEDVGKEKPQSLPTFDALTTLGQHLSFTERRADDAERELRQVKLLELLEKHVGDEYLGVVSSITKFGIFIQLDKWLIEGLVKYPDLLNDYWKADEKAGVVRGERTGRVIHVGDVCKVQVARVDVSRRELDLFVKEITARGSERSGSTLPKPSSKAKDKKHHFADGKSRRAQKSRSRDQRKGNKRRDRN